MAAAAPRTSRESTTIRLFRSCLEKSLLTSDEFQAMGSYWLQDLGSVPDPSIKAEQLQAFILGKFGGPCNSGQEGMTRGVEILGSLKVEQNAMAAEMLRQQQLSRHQEIRLRKEREDKAREEEERKKAAAQKQRKAAIKAKREETQRPSGGVGQNMYGNQANQYQMQQQQQQHQQNLPDIFKELMAVETQDPRFDANVVTHGSTTSQSIIDKDLEVTESDQAKRLMREGIVAAGGSGNGGDATASGGGAAAAASAASQNWWETNMIDYISLQKSYLRVQDATGLKPTGAAMRLLSKAIQNHAVKVLGSALQQATRRTSTDTLDEYAKLYVLAGEDPTVRGQLYCMKWGPDVLGVLKAEEESAKVMSRLGAEGVLQHVRATLTTEQQMAAAVAEEAGGRKRKSGEAGIGAPTPSWILGQGHERKNALGLEQLAKLYYTEECLGVYKRSGGAGQLHAPGLGGGQPGAVAAATATAAAAVAAAATTATATASTTTSAAAAASSAMVLATDPALGSIGGGDAGSSSAAALAQRQELRQRILLAISPECPVVRPLTAQDRRVMKSDVLVALADVKAATGSVALLKSLVFAKEKAKE